MSTQDRKHAAHGTTRHTASRPSTSRVGSHAQATTRPSVARGSARAVKLASESTSIETIRTGQGARVTTRANAAEAAGRARKNAESRYLERHPEARTTRGPERTGLRVVLLVVAAILALAVVFVVGTLVVSLLFPQKTEETPLTQTLRPTESELAVQQEMAAHDAGQEVASVDGSVSYSDGTYSLAQQDDGTWALVVDGSSALFTFEGTPVALARGGAVLLVGENIDGGWDVLCHVIGGHSSATYLVGEDGQPVHGEDDATSVEITDTVLRVTDASGSTTEVAYV